MWQRFTDRARKIILLGQEEARRMGSSSVGTEHLLLGLVRENEGVAAQVLERLGVSLSKVRHEVEQESPTRGEARAGEPNLSPRAKRVLELAADEARRMNHNYIGTEHLLLALLREKEGSAAKVLRQLGINLEQARQQVIEYLGPEATAGEGQRRRSNLLSAFYWLLHVIELSAEAAKAESSKERLKTLHAELNQMSEEARRICELEPEFEWAAKRVMRSVEWFKEHAVNSADYERAASLRDMHSKLQSMLDEIRKILAEDS